MRFFLISLFFFNVFNSYSQSEHEYMGVILLQDSTFISYKISFVEEHGIINGYSITDLSGAHETKSMIVGTFNKKEKNLQFKESGIVYTKSPITQNDFCYIHFNGRLARLNDRRNITGTFTGKYADGAVCINGEIDMKSIVKIEKRATKIDKAVDKSVLVSKEDKERVNLRRTLDTLTTNYIRANEVVQVFTQDAKMDLVVMDVGQNDGDKISIYIDNKPLLEDALIKTEPTTYAIPLVATSVKIRIVATSAGSIGSNTVQLTLKDSKNTIDSVTNMAKNETAEFVIIRQR